MLSSVRACACACMAATPLFSLVAQCITSWNGLAEIILNYDYTNYDNFNA